MKRMNKMPGARAFLAGALLTGSALFFIQARTADPYFEISKNLDIYTNIFKELNTYYVDPIEPGKLVKTGVDAMLMELDPYTNFITEADIEDYEFMTTGKYGGIGANMQRKGDEIYIADVYENSPAQMAGLHPGDFVESIDGQSLKGKNVEDLGLLLKGSSGTQVKMKIRDAYTQEVSERILTRAEIEISSVPYAGFVGPQSDFAYVRLTQFTQHCGTLVRDAFDSLKNAKPNLKGLVLDLRNNPGGLLDEAIVTCNIFMDKGQSVLTTRYKISDMDKEYKTALPAWNKDLPLAVLVNKSSASASEIVAGSIQDLDRGVVVGERSYGKGLVQVTRPVGFKSQLKLTVARYYTPSGRCIQALDYTHRNADGTVNAFSDSMKKTFKTRAGRKVQSGGGVTPDVTVKDDAMSLVAVNLYSKNYIFDYATLYASKHKTITDPSKFTLTEAEFNEFAKWVENKDFSYKTTTESQLDSLKKTALEEKYFDNIKSEFEALKNKLSHDKKQDLLKHKEQVRHVLESEIASRYYYARGRMAQTMQYDKEIAKAVTILSSPAEYNALLKPGK
jgi:carboxyl-terminal processing protease